MSTSPLPALTFSFIIYETKRIITSNFPHFNYLSVLFILPISFSLTIFPAVHTLLLRRCESPPSSDHPQFHDLALGLSLSLFPAVFTILSVGSITHSVTQIHHNRTPVALLAAVKSAFTSFFPIAVTQFVANFLYSLIALILYFAIKFAFGIYPESPWFHSAATVIVLASVLICLEVNWALASVVAADESRIGFSALKQSSYLVAGERFLVLRIILTYGLVLGSYVWTSWYWMPAGGGWGHYSWLLSAATILLMWFILTRLLLSLFVAKTVVYLYCKAAHGGRLIFVENGGLPFGNDDDEKRQLLV
ncbi:hypothetical protein LINGRAHAP2_LOCUS9694 [Linum grandiflorum]